MASTSAQSARRCTSPPLPGNFSPLLGLSLLIMEIDCDMAGSMGFFLGALFEPWELFYVVLLFFSLRLFRLIYPSPKFYFLIIFFSCLTSDSQFLARWMYVLFPTMLIIGNRCLCVRSHVRTLIRPSLLFREKQKTSSSHLSLCMVVCAAPSHIPM